MVSMGYRIRSAIQEKRPEASAVMAGWGRKYLV
jgi:hypothetical protein